MALATDRTLVVISHHPPSRKGLNPRHAGNGLDGAYASDLDGLVADWPAIRHWVHGHTHIRKRYRVGATIIHANCRGFEGKDPSAAGFPGPLSFDVDRAWRHAIGD
jgi:hypothetical protein